MRTSMSEPLSPWSEEAAVRAHAIETCLRDAQSDGLRRLEDYLAMFPGYEAAVREEWEQVKSSLSGTETSSPTFLAFPREIGGY
jgi:hypothetical protein